MVKRYFICGVVSLLLLGFTGSQILAAVDSALSKKLSGGLTTADHSRFAELDKPFASGPEVTKACLKCHNQAASQVHSSIHWNWESNEGDEKALGKANVVNNF